MNRRGISTVLVIKMVLVPSRTARNKFAAVSPWLFRIASHPLILISGATDAAILQVSKAVRREAAEKLSSEANFCLRIVARPLRVLARLS